MKRVIALLKLSSDTTAYSPNGAGMSMCDRGEDVPLYTNHVPYPS